MEVEININEVDEVDEDVEFHDFCDKLEIWLLIYAGLYGIQE